jgi:hypothetical protein
MYGVYIYTFLANPSHVSCVTPAKQVAQCVSSPQAGLPFHPPGPFFLLLLAEFNSHTVGCGRPQPIAVLFSKFCRKCLHHGVMLLLIYYYSLINLNFPILRPN